MCKKTLPYKSEATVVGPESRVRENMLKITIHWLIKFDMIAPSVFETVAKSTMCRSLGYIVPLSFLSTFIFLKEEHYDNVQRGCNFEVMVKGESICQSGTQPL